MKIDKILSDIKGILDELNKLPKLNYVELTGELNDLLWKYDAISECNERIEKCLYSEDIEYYMNKQKEYFILIKNNYTHILN